MYWHVSQFDPKNKEIYQQGLELFNKLSDVDKELINRYAEGRRRVFRNMERLEFKPMKVKIELSKTANSNTNKDADKDKDSKHKSVPVAAPPPPPSQPPVSASSTVAGGGGGGGTAAAQAAATAAAIAAAVAAERVRFKQENDAFQAQVTAKLREQEERAAADLRRVKKEYDASHAPGPAPGPTFNSVAGAAAAAAAAMFTSTHMPATPEPSPPPFGGGGNPLSRAATVINGHDSSSGLDDITGLLARVQVSKGQIQNNKKQIKAKLAAGDTKAAHEIAKSVTRATVSTAVDAQLTANQMRATDYRIMSIEVAGQMDVVQVYAKLYPGGQPTTTREFVNVYKATLANNRCMFGLDSETMEQLRAKYDGRAQAKAGDMFNGTPVLIKEGTSTRKMNFVELGLDTFKQANERRNPEKRLFCQYLHMELMRVVIESASTKRSGSRSARTGDINIYGLAAADIQPPTPMSQ